VGGLSLNQFLTIYTWFPLAALILFLFLIARFYEKFSGQKTYFRLFILPIVFFGASAVRSASNDVITEDVAASLLAAAGGLSLLFLTINLSLKMLNQSQNKDISP